MMKRSITKYIQIIIFGFTIATVLPGCETQEILVPEIEFFIAKEWRIQEAYRDGILLTDETINAGENLQSYRLKLNEDFTFDQLDVQGNLRTGAWALTSGLQQLVLFQNQPETEHWLIIDLQIRRLEIKQEATKDNRDVRFILVPVKGQ